MRQEEPGYPLGLVDRDRRQQPRMGREPGGSLVDRAGYQPAVCRGPADGRGRRARPRRGAGRAGAAASDAQPANVPHHADLGDVGQRRLDADTRLVAAVLHDLSGRGVDPALQWRPDQEHDRCEQGPGGRRAGGCGEHGAGSQTRRGAGVCERAPGRSWRRPGAEQRDESVGPGPRRRQPRRAR